MTRPRIVSMLTLALALLLSLLLVATTATAAQGGSSKPVRHHGHKVVFLDYNYQQEVAPARIFFYANSGPYVRHLKWTNWGRQHTVAHGRYINDCASCGPKRNVRATLKFSHLAYCKTRHVYYYKQALLYRKPAAGQDNPARIDDGSCPPPRRH